MPRALKKIFRTLSRGSVVSAGAAAETATAAPRPTASDVEAGVSEVRLFPDSEELGRQSVLKARKIEQSVFRIGRRLSDSLSFPDNDPPEMLIFEKSPFTVSKLHCQIEWFCWNHC